MIRKLMFTAAVLAIAGSAFAQVVPNAPFDNNPWTDSIPTLGSTGYLAHTYHFVGVHSHGSGASTVWHGREWDPSGLNGAPTTYDDAIDKDVFANMATMGIAVFSPFGVNLVLEERFFEYHSQYGNHESPYTVEIDFSGTVGTNKPINIGLAAIAGGYLQFPSGTGHPTVTKIEAWKDGSLVNTWNNPTNLTQAYFTHNHCHADFIFRIFVEIPTHVKPGMTHLPFYFCPEEVI